MDKKRTKAFLNLLPELQFTDLIAFGKILEVEEQEKIEDFVANILIKFNEKPRNTRRKLLKLATDVAKENKINKKLIEKEAKAESESRAG